MLANRLEFDPGIDVELFAAVPAVPAVFLLRGADAQEPYVSKSANLRRRLQRLLGAPAERSKRLNLRHRVSTIEYTLTGSEFESRFLLYKTLRIAFPKTYTHRLRLRFAPLVKLHMENEYPRASVTTRLGRLQGRSIYYGPFASRPAAEKFANDSLDFFKMRRCVEDLHPDPKFPGCIYSEMKMCLAPCFKGCTDEEYRAEVDRVVAYFDSSGDSLIREITTGRDAASARLDFENAAAWHARLEKIKPVVGQIPEIVGRIDRQAGILIQPSVTPGCVNLFRVDAACVSGPAAFAIQAAEHARSQSMESRLQGAYEAISPAGTRAAMESMEHLALLKQWFYRSTREGELYLADEKGALPWRRIVRGVSRVFKGEKTEPTEAIGRPPEGGIAKQSGGI